MSIVRVAAVQFAVGEDPADNLATCLRMTDEAAALGARIVVLPEFCNHVSWYDDRAHARRMAQTPTGPFVTALADEGPRARAAPDGELHDRPRGRPHHRHQHPARPRGHDPRDQRQAGADGQRAGPPRPGRRGLPGRRHRARPDRPLLLHGRRHQRDAADARRRRRPDPAQQPELLRPRRGLPARARPGGREPGLGGRRQQGRSAGAGAQHRDRRRQGRRARSTGCTAPARARSSRPTAPSSRSPRSAARRWWSPTSTSPSPTTSDAPTAPT